MNLNDEKKYFFNTYRAFRRIAKEIEKLEGKDFVKAESFSERDRISSRLRIKLSLLISSNIQGTKAFSFGIGGGFGEVKGFGGCWGWSFLGW